MLVIDGNTNKFYTDVREGISFLTMVQNQEAINKR